MPSSLLKVCFYISIEIGKRRLLFIGTTIMVVSYSAVITLIYTCREREECTDYILFVSIPVIIDSIAYSASISTIWFVYIINILPERGFTLLMSFHWITTFSLEGTYRFLSISSMIILLDAIEYFCIFYCIAAILVTYYKR